LEIFGACKATLDLAVRFEPLIPLLRPIGNGASRPALGGIIMKQFFFAVALTFALAAGAVTVLTLQLTLAAAQTFTFGVGTLTGLTVQPQPAKTCPSTSGCRQR
jgi:hypothetical protein